MRFLGLLAFLFFQISCSSSQVGKMNGVSFVGSREKVEQAHVDEILKINANHAAVMPFGFIREPNSPDIVFDTERQWYGETKKGARQYIEMLQKNGVKVMLKPQIWIWRGVFTGTLKMQSEQDWQKLERSYETFIMAYARLAAGDQYVAFVHWYRVGTIRKEQTRLLETIDTKNKIGL